MSFPTFTVLMVEDFAADRELYRRSLYQQSDCLYELLEAESVAVGLELCQARSIDAVLLDYILPDGDGLDFLSELSMRSNGKMPPVVMMSGQGSESAAARAIKLGAEDYLVKRDLTPELLQLKVRKSIENARLRQQQQQELALQKQAEFSLKAANQRIIAIWESMTDAYVTLDHDWRILYTNPAARQVYYQTTGLVPAEYLGKTHWEIFPWTIGTIVEQNYKWAVAEQVAVNFELFYEPAKTWFEIHAYPSPEGLGVYFRDINQRKLDELARSAAERERDRFFDSSLDLLIVASFDGYFVRVNPACEKILGFTAAEIMAQPFLNFVHPDDLAATSAVAKNLSEGGVLDDFENRYRCKDGSYRWILWSAIPDMERGLMYANGHDITDRKIAELNDRLLVQALREQEQQTKVAQAIIEQQLREIETIYQTAPVGLCFVDTDLRFVRLNERLAEINHLPVAAHIGRTLSEVLPTGNQLESLYRQVIESGEPIIDLELTTVDPTQPGGVVYFLVRYYPQKDAQGQVVGVNAMVQEITDRKRDQAALEERNKELDAFVFVVSHDLKAPLRAVANLSQWIEEDLEDQLTADTQLQMDLLRSRVHRMSATIDGLLEYARIGRSEDEIESVDLAKLLSEVIDEVAPLPTFTIDLPDDLPTLLTKRLPLFQIFVNLIGNGIKHHHSVTGSIEISIEDQVDWYEFAIADDGPGIALENQERMFQIFQAVNPQNRSDSTGIGLAIVKKIVEAEGGTIWLESEMGHGTTFYFTWPKR